MTGTLPEFKAWPKIPRAAPRLIITEKLDGTNGIIHIAEDGETITFGSRSRWLVEGQDNFGFRAWGETNKADLLKLGPGYHYGEWWGLGIQRTYGLTEKRFSLFNTHRWNDQNPNRPTCCGVVPILPFKDGQEAVEFLVANGSVAAPGFMRPEGIVLHYLDSGCRRKMFAYDQKDQERLDRKAAE